MEIFHDTLALHQGGRINSEQTKITSDDRIHETRISEQTQWEKEIKDGRVEVQEILSRTKIYGFRGYFGMRNAFDFIVMKLGGPKVMWKNSDQWFRCAMEIIACDSQFALLAFEKNTHIFLHTFKDVIVRAEVEAMARWMYNKTREEYADLMGARPDAIYLDRYRYLSSFTEKDQEGVIRVTINGQYHDIYPPVAGLD